MLLPESQAFCPKIFATGGAAAPPAPPARTPMAERMEDACESHCEKHLLLIRTPFSVVLRNRRHLCTVTSPGRCERPDEQDLDLEPESQAGSGSGSPHAAPEEPPQTVKPCRVTPAVPFSANTQSSSPQPDVRTSSGRVVRKPARFKRLCLICAFANSNSNIA